MFPGVVPSQDSSILRSHSIPTLLGCRVKILAILCFEILLTSREAGVHKPSEFRLALCFGEVLRLPAVLRAGKARFFWSFGRFEDSPISCGLVEDSGRELPNYVTLVP